MSHGHEHAVITTPTPPGFITHKVAHHYDSHVQEYQSCKLVFWLFLATEIMLFGGVFAAYMVYHGLYHQAFTVGGQQLNWKLGALNTGILLISSYTMAMAVRAAQLSQRKPMLILLGLTLLGAFGFLAVKYFEYTAKIEHGLLPGEFFHPHEPTTTAVLHGVRETLAWADIERPNLFFSFYWTMTGIHGFHVLVGAVLILWIMKRGAKGYYHSGHYLPVDLIGLYWHLVDLIWIFLFPLLYLVP